MFGLQSVLGISQRTDPRQDSGSSASSKLSLDSKTSELTSRGSTFSFLSRSNTPSSLPTLSCALHDLVMPVSAFVLQVTLKTVRCSAVFLTLAGLPHSDLNQKLPTTIELQSALWKSAMVTACFTIWCHCPGSKGSSVEPSFEVSCEAAIRPSFCWNSHQDTWQAGGVWSQFESGLKSCQVNVSACANFMGHKDAAFAGLRPKPSTCLSAMLRKTRVFVLLQRSGLVSNAWSSAFDHISI